MTRTERFQRLAFISAGRRGETPVIRRAGAPAEVAERWRDGWLRGAEIRRTRTRPNGAK